MIMKMPIGEIVPGGGGFKFNPDVVEQIPVKLTPKIPLVEQTAKEIIDVTDEPEFHFEELLYGPLQAEEISKNLAQSHQRPLSNSEYQHLLDLLDRGYHLDTQAPVYDHEKAAIALVVNGNFLKFYGDYVQDPLIRDAFQVAGTLTKAFAPDVSQAQMKLTDQLRVKAESVPEKYTDSEKVDLKTRGIAFANLVAKPEPEKITLVSPDAPEMMPTKTIETRASSLQHPMAHMARREAIKQVTKTPAHPMLSFGLIPTRSK